MQEKSHPRHETIFIGIPAEALELLDRVQAGMGRGRGVEPRGCGVMRPGYPAPPLPRNRLRAARR